MAGTRIYMTAEKQQSLSEIHAKIHYIEGAEQIFHQEMSFDGAVVWLLVYEKSYLHSIRYVSLTVLLTEQGTKQTAQIIAAGGYAFTEFCTGSRGIARECVQTLERCGFCVDPERSDSLPQSLKERFFK